MAAYIAPRALDIAGLSDDLEVRLILQQQSQTAANHLVVIGEDDSDYRHRRESLVLSRFLARRTFVTAHRLEGTASTVGADRALPDGQVPVAYCR
jgi:hypothetical protein